MNAINDVLCDGRLALQVTTLGWGGTERYVQDLSIEYARRGLKPLVIVDSAPLIRKGRMEAEGVEVNILDVPSSILKDEYCKALRAVLCDKNVRLLHANSWVRWEWIQDICLQENVGCIRTHHSDESGLIRCLLGITWPKIWLKSWRAKLKAQRTRAAVINVSHCSCRRLRRAWGGRVRITPIHHGIPPVSHRANPGSKENEPVFCWVGALTRLKRPLLLLKAFGEVVKEFPGVSLIIAGDGPERATAESFARQKLPGKVRFLGFTDRIGEIMGQSQIFVLTSKREGEGFPYVVLEAMAAGLPVVATAFSAVKEMVLDGRTGLIIPNKKDASGLGEAMKNLARNPALRKSMGDAGYRRWKEMFTIDSMVGETLQAYCTLLTTGRSDRSS